MIRTGFVKEKKGDQLRVCFDRPEACEGCKGCAKGLLPKKELLTVTGQAEVGDMVDVQMPDAQMLKATLLAYAMPLALFLIGMLVANACQLSDAVTGLLALAGLALGYIAARMIDVRLRRLPRWRSQVVNVYSAKTNKNERT